MTTGTLGRIVGRARSLAILATYRAVRVRERPSLSVEEHLVTRPRFPVLDVHRHLNGPFSGPWTTRTAAELERHLDQVGVERIVDLDGTTGPRLVGEIERFRGIADRVAVFAGIDYGLIASSDAFGEAMATDLRRSRDAGAVGLKVWKTLGLHARDRQGRLVAIDDERLDPLWDAARELGMPIMIHVADPRAFFDRLTRSNERWEELHRHPEWYYWPPRPRGRTDHPGYPSHAELIEQFRAVLARHPRTTFIGSHLAGCAEDLGLVGSMLEDHPNLLVDISARVAELGRQPYSAHDFIVRYASRVLFGSDEADGGGYGLYYRLLETRDEYFDYGLGRDPLNGRWRVYGLGLPEGVLEQVYNLNARRIVWASGR